MDLAAAHTLGPADRLRAAVPVLAAHDPRLPVDSDRVDAITELNRIRFGYLAEIDALIHRQNLPEVRVDLLLGYHHLVLMWVADIVGGPVEAADFDGVDRAVYDMVSALLLWHVMRDFHPTQRLVSTCLVTLDRVQPSNNQPTSDTNA